MVYAVARLLLHTAVVPINRNDCGMLFSMVKIKIKKSEKLFRKVLTSLT